MTERQLRYHFQIFTILLSFLRPRHINAFSIVRVASITIHNTRRFKAAPVKRKQTLLYDSKDGNEMETILLECISKGVSESMEQEIKLQYTTGARSGGGGGAKTYAVQDPISNAKYFVKTAPIKKGGDQMLYAEYLGVMEMAETNSVKVPRPIAYGTTTDNVNTAGKDDLSFVVFEFLDLTYGCSGYDLGVQLANMHRTTSSSKLFGFHVNNTIGATPQPNLPQMSDWAEFWDVHRLGHMLFLTNNVGGMSEDIIKKLRIKTRELLSEEHDPAPSCLHGDLWGGNKGCCLVDVDDVNDGYEKEQKKVKVPVIFDPATYYGDREADIAMTYLFGGFGADFYKGYEDTWPLPAGHEKRRTVYNLYHIMNHYVLFGGSYRREARDMIKEILSY